MATLGPDFRYRTVLLAPPVTDGATEPGVIRGDLFLQATGDPSLTPEGLAEVARSSMLGIRSRIASPRRAS